MNPTSELHQAGEIQLEQFVAFRLDNEEYAVPILSVTEVVPTLEITPVPNAPTYILGLASLRGKIVPILDLEKKFQLSRNSPATGQHIMVAESEQKVLFGILVDQVEEVLKVPTSTIKPPPDIVKSKISAEYLPGVIVLEKTDGGAAERILLILDLQKILSDKNIEELHAVHPDTTQPAPVPDNQANQQGGQS